MTNFIAHAATNHRTNPWSGAVPGRTAERMDAAVDPAATMLSARPRQEDPR